MINASNDSADTPAGKLTYRAPTLTVFGSVRELTRSGINSAGEGSSGKGPSKLSDPALKESIVRIGEHPAGFGLYLFDYKAEVRDACGHGRMFGVMADEVQAIMPEAVSVGGNGYRQVNYAMLGITFH